MSNGRFTLDDAQRTWVQDWWRALQPRERVGLPLPASLNGLDRGARAALRRAGNADVLLLVAPVHLLAEKIIALDSKRRYRRFENEPLAYYRIALVAGVLAQVRDGRIDRPDDKTLAWRLGRAAADQPPMSELRFKRLLKSEGEADLLRQWRRAVRLAEGTTDVARLADDLLSWQIEADQPPVRASDGVKFRWAYDYYLSKREQAAAEQPASIEEMTE